MAQSPRSEGACPLHGLTRRKRAKSQGVISPEDEPRFNWKRLDVCVLGRFQPNQCLSRFELAGRAEDATPEMT